MVGRTVVDEVVQAKPLLVRHDFWLRPPGRYRQVTGFEAGALVRHKNVNGRIIGVLDSKEIFALGFEPDEQVVPRLAILGESTIDANYHFAYSPIDVVELYDERVEPARTITVIP